jgi:hypothetical protein
VSRIRRKGEEDQILRSSYIKGRINTSQILTDKKAAFFFVVIPEEMIILHAQGRAVRRFDARGRLHRQRVPRSCGQNIQLTRNRIKCRIAT